MKTLLIVATFTALGLSGAAAQTTPDGSASGTTNGAMQPDSTGTIGSMHSSSTDPASGGSAPAGAASTDGMMMVDGKWMMNGKPATKAQIAEHKKMMRPSK